MSGIGSGRTTIDEHETPYRCTVAATWHGACKLSRTILSFSSSDHCRRRPVSATSRRSTWALRLSLFTSTILNNTPHSARRSSPAEFNRSDRRSHGSTDPTPRSGSSCRDRVPAAKRTRPRITISRLSLLSLGMATAPKRLTHRIIRAWCCRRSLCFLPVAIHPQAWLIEIHCWI